MKKRILAALLAVAMVAGVCTFAGAETVVEDPNATPGVDAPVAEATPAAEEVVLVYEEDFEGSPAPIMGDKFVVTGDPSDPTDKVLSYTDTSWGTAVSEPLIKDCNPTQVYTIQFEIYGDISVLGLVFNHEQWNRVPVSNGADTQTNIVGVETTDPNTGEVTSSLLYNRPLKNEWNTYVATFSGYDQYRFAIMTQSQYGVNGGTVCVDDIKIWKGDATKMLAATPEPTVAPTVAPTAAVTVTPSSSATAAPTATATVDTGKTDDNGTTAKKSIKFKKKKVTIKKGKKATLKVTIKGAKKAKFSVNKKGKKVVKLMKKKAKKVTVKGKKKGKATITAKAAGKKATCKVTVK